MAKKKFYAVKNGLNPGIYDTWEECKSQIAGVTAPKYKSFKTLEDAEAFMRGEREHQEFILPYAYAFVDGSFNTSTKVYGFGGFVAVGDEKHLISGSGNDPEVSKLRNVAGELKGAMTAVRTAEKLGLTDILIYYDYQGIEKWVTGEWQAKQPATQAYRDFMRNRKIHIKFQKVEAHTGVPGNEIADRLAKEAVGL